ALQPRRVPGRGGRRRGRARAVRPRGHARPGLCEGALRGDRRAREPGPARGGGAGAGRAGGAGAPESRGRAGAPAPEGGCLVIPRAAVAATCAAVSLSLACRRPAPPPASPAVARVGGRTTPAADVDRAVLDLPPAQRQPADGDLLSWYGRIARELALERARLGGGRAAGVGA